MAFPADTNWRWDPSGGNNANGGGFAASISGGARITSPVTYTDLVIDAADNTKISSAGERAFTATDAGNVINITSGTGWTVQRAIINSVAGGVATMDRAMGTVGSTGGNGRLGGALAVFTDAILELSVAGNTHEVWATATMTLTESLNVAADGSSAAPISMVGCASDGSAEPTGDNRPLIATGIYGFTNYNASHYIWENVRFTGTGSNVLRVGDSTRISRCKVYNSSTTVGRNAFYGSRYASFSDCEAQSNAGIGINCALTGEYVTRCYVHDCNQGAGSPAGISCSSYIFMNNCIVDTCRVGLVCAASQLIVPHNCTFYGCTTSISGTTAYSIFVENNILAGAAGTETGASWGTETPSNQWDYNDFYNLGTDRTNVTAGTHDFDADPLFTDAANGDFSRTETVADGIGITLGVG